MSQNNPVTVQPFLYAEGCLISKASNTTLSVGAGQVRDSNDVMDLPIGSQPLNGPTTDAPVVIDFGVNGVNGLDTGTIAASTMYAVYVIGSSQFLQPVACIATLASNSAPSMPRQYDSYRLIGYWPTDGSSHLILGYVSGTGKARKFTYDAPVATAITAGNATSYTGIALTAFVPPVDNTPVNVFTALTPGAAGRAVSLQGYDSTGDAVVILGQVTSVVVNSYNTVLAQLNTAAPSIKYKVSNSGDAVAVNVAGYDFSI